MFWCFQVYDGLEANEAELFGKFCGLVPPQTITSSLSSGLYLSYYSTEGHVERGFESKFYMYADGKLYCI